MARPLQGALLLLAVTPGLSRTRGSPDALVMASDHGGHHGHHRNHIHTDANGLAGDGGDTASWDRYIASYTLDRFEEFVNCTVKQFWYANWKESTVDEALAQTEKRFLEDQPSDDVYLHFPIRAEENSRVKEHILLEKMVGKGTDDDPCFVILSTPDRKYLAKQLVDQLIDIGAKGKILIVNGVHPMVKKAKGGNKGNEKDTRTVVMRGVRDHVLPIVYKLGGNRLHIFFEDDALLCTTDISDIVQEAQKAPLMWLGYNAGMHMTWGAQLWSLWREAMPAWHRYLTFTTTGHYDATLREMLAPRANRSWASGRPHGSDEMHSGTSQKTQWDCHTSSDNYERETLEVARHNSLDGLGWKTKFWKPCMQQLLPAFADTARLRS